jgi:hypothetical protein
MISLCIKLAILETAVLGIYKLLDTFLGAFKSNTLLCGANASNPIAIVLSIDNVPFNCHVFD